MGIKALRKVQLGKEATSGTAVAATTIWRGLGAIEDRREVKFAEEDVGYLSGVNRAYLPKLLAAITLEGAATFEQLPHILAAGVKSVVTGVADGAGSGKIYDYLFPTTAANTIKTYTIEGGDDTQEEEMEYSFVEAFKISGKPNEALMVSADYLGRQVAASSFTGALSLVTVEDILFNKGKLYIDAGGGTIGTTQKTNTFIGMDLSVKTGWIPVFTGDGQLYFTFAKSTLPEVLLDVTFEYDGSATAEIVQFKAGGARLIRCLFQGTALATPGTAYTYKTLRIDLAGTWEKFDKIDEIDGNDVVTGRFRARYHSAASLFADIIVVNEVTALP
jgi:hypothetical protein